MTRNVCKIYLCCIGTNLHLKIKKNKLGIHFLTDSNILLKKLILCLIFIGEIPKYCYTI